MKYRTRIAYYAVISLFAILLSLAPTTTLTELFIYGALIYLPIAIAYLLINEILLGRWLPMRESNAQTLLMVTLGLILLGISLITFGLSKDDLFAAQIGTAVIFIAGETSMKRTRSRPH